MKTILRAALLHSHKSITTPKNALATLNSNNNLRTFLVPKIAYFFTQQSMKSRDIDKKISQERWKNLQNNYKALKTSFGLQIPKTITKNHPTPQRILFNMQTLRQCSNQYPEYLLEELNLPESKFLKVIDVNLTKIGSAQKKEALEFLLFLIHWKIYLKDQEIGQMILRAINKIDLSMFDIFQFSKVVLKKSAEQSQSETNELLKTNPQMREKLNILNFMDPIMKQLLTICQTSTILRLQVIDAQEYEPLFKIINMFRLYDVYPEVKKVKKSQKKTEESKEDKNAADQEVEDGFFEIIQKRLLKNLNEIPPPSLVIMAVHYANNTKEKQDDRIHILQKMEERILFTMKFFNHDELIAILYSYLKTSLMSENFIRQLVKRIKLIYSELNWSDKKKILSLAGNFPQHEKIQIIAEAHNEIFKGKPVITKLQDGTVKKEFNPKVFVELDYQLVPQIYLASYENNMLTEELCRRMQDIILLNIYNYDREEVVRSVWLFTVSPSVDNNLERLHKKLEVIIEGGFQAGEYTVKDISIIVWSLCNSGVNNQQIYKGDAKFWENIEFYIQEKLQKQDVGSEPSRLSNISSILWAYTFNRSLKFKTVSLITQIILQEMTYPSKQHPEANVQSFQLINILTFYYSLPNKSFPVSLLNKVKEICVVYFQALYKEMNSLQLMKCLKYLAAEEYSEGLQMKLVIKIKIWEDIIETFRSEASEIEYEHIMGIVGLVVNSPLGRAKDKRVMDLVNKLLKRKKALEQIKIIQQLAEKSKQ